MFEDDKCDGFVRNESCNVTWGMSRTITYFWVLGNVLQCASLLGAVIITSFLSLHLLCEMIDVGM